MLDQGQLLVGYFNIKCFDFFIEKTIASTVKTNLGLYSYLEPIFQMRTLIIKASNVSWKMQKILLIYRLCFYHYNK